MTSITATGGRKTARKTNSMTEEQSQLNTPNSANLTRTSSTNNDDEHYSHQMADQHFSTVEKYNFSSQNGLDFLATIACSIKITDTETQKDSGEDLVSVQESDSVEEFFSEDEMEEPQTALTGVESSFVPHDMHGWITEPPPGTCKEFLDMNIVDPVDKRICLAFHTAYCEKIKEDELKRRWREVEITRCFQQLQTQQLLQLQQNRENKMKIKRKIDKVVEDEQDEEKIDHVLTWMKEISTFYLHEPHVLRRSIYEKYVQQYQFYYNEHDTEGMVKNTMLPYCAKDVMRRNCFWDMLPVTDSQTGNIQKRAVMIDDKTSYGVDSLEMTFNMIFQKFPDLMMIHHQSRKRYDVNKKITQMHTPFTAFFATTISEDALKPPQQDGSPPVVPVVKNSKDNSKNSKKRKTVSLLTRRTIRFEATGWNLVQFNENNQVTVRVTHICFVGIEGLRAGEEHLSPTMVWAAVWK